LLQTHSIFGVSDYLVFSTLFPRAFYIWMNIWMILYVS